jgi:hypothetical protein
LPAKGKTEVLKAQLEEYLKDPEAARAKQEEAKQAAKEAKAEERKKKRKGWIDWKNSAAREIMWEDLEVGGWLHGRDDQDAKVVFEIYQERDEEFKDIVFSQFEAKYNEAIKKPKSGEQGQLKKKNG